MDKEHWEKYFDDLDRLITPLSHFLGSRYREKILQGLSMSQLLILKLLAHEPKLTTTKLSEKIGVTPAAISKLIDQLVQEGYIQRIRSEKDRRVIMIEMTPAGANILKANNQLRRDIFKELLSGLADEDLHTFLSFVEKMHSNLSNLDKSE